MATAASLIESPSPESARETTSHSSATFTGGQELLNIARTGKANQGTHWRLEIDIEEGTGYRD